MSVDLLLAHASPQLRISGGAFLSRRSRFYLFLVANHKNGLVMKDALYLWAGVLYMEELFTLAL